MVKPTVEGRRLWIKFRRNPTEFFDEEEKEKFETGDIIDKRNIILKVTAGSYIISLS